MLLPIGDSPNPPGTPWVTYGLIAVNVGIFLALLPLTGEAPTAGDPLLAEYLRALGDAAPAAGVTRYDLVLFAYGFRPAEPSALDLVTAMFLHGGWLHLGGNMLYLWIFGDNVEHRLGRVGALAVYLGTGILAGLGDAALRPGSPIPSVGASGAISGLLGCYFVWFPANKVRVLLLLFPFYVGTVDLPVRLVLGLFVLVDNLLPFLLLGSQGGVSYGAHLGGFVGGAALALALARLGLRGRDPASSCASLIAAGLDAERNGDMQGALRTYLQAIAASASATESARAHLGAARIYLAAGALAQAFQHIEAVANSDAGPTELSEAGRLLEVVTARSRRPPGQRWRW